jgi:IS5 family transposase
MRSTISLRLAISAASIWGVNAPPDATTLLNFRRLLEKHQLGAALFAKVGGLLLANGMKLSGGTIMDATLITALPSAKNQEQSRDPEMHQCTKGNQWYFGTKLHIGADSHSGLVHSASVTNGQRARQPGVAQPVAWPGDSALWRQRLSGQEAACATQGDCAQGQGLKL